MRAAPRTEQQLRRGRIGDKFAAGEVLVTASGRLTPPFPKIDCGTNRKAIETIKRVDQWLMENALTEAETRGDAFNALQFRRHKDKPSRADKDVAELYLFGDEQPAVVRSILRPLPGQVPL